MTSKSILFCHDLLLFGNYLGSKIIFAVLGDLPYIMKLRTDNRKGNYCVATKTGCKVIRLAKTFIAKKVYKLMVLNYI